MIKKIFKKYFKKVLTKVFFSSRLIKSLQINDTEPDNWPVRPEEDPQWNCRKAQPEDSLSTMKFNINDYVKTKHNQPIKNFK